MGLFDEKNRGSKISWHCPFKYISQIFDKDNVGVYPFKDISQLFNEEIAGVYAYKDISNPSVCAN
jgi:hypothetical protein